MHVFGHDHIPQQRESVPHTDLLQNPHEAISRPRSSEVRLVPVTIEGHKVHIAASIKALQDHRCAKCYPRGPCATAVYLIATGCMGGLFHVLFKTASPGK